MVVGCEPSSEGRGFCEVANRPLGYRRAIIGLVWLPRRARSLERGDRLRQILVSRKEIQQSHHLKRLNCELGRLEQADATPALFCSSQVANQHANAAGVNRGHFLDIENNLVMRLAEQLVHRRVETVERLTHT
jgi:hypothetical protein